MWGEKRKNVELNACMGADNAMDGRVIVINVAF